MAYKKSKKIEGFSEIYQYIFVLKNVQTRDNKRQNKAKGNKQRRRAAIEEA